MDKSWYNKLCWQKVCQRKVLKIIYSSTYVLWEEAESERGKNFKTKRFYKGENTMVKIKEKLVKLLAVAFVGTMPILGLSNIASAKGSSSNFEQDMDDTAAIVQGLAEAEQYLAEARQILASLGQSIPQMEFELGGAIGTNEAFECYRRAAEHGHVQAQFYLGEHYRLSGVAGDRNEALRWYQRAADQGHAGAQRILMMYYENGETFPLGR